MQTRQGLGSVRGYRSRRVLMRGAARLRALAMLLFYGCLGLAGVMLWLLVQMPISGRWKESLVVAMAGCLGLFAMGWQMLRPERAGALR